MQDAITTLTDLGMDVAAMITRTNKMLKSTEGQPVQQYWKGRSEVLDFLQARIRAEINVAKAMETK